MKFKHVDFVDSRVTQARAIVEAVMEAGHAPCSMQLEHEEALWGACALLDQALKRLRGEKKS